MLRTLSLRNIEECLWWTHLIILVSEGSKWFQVWIDEYQPKLCHNNYHTEKKRFNYLNSLPKRFFFLLCFPGLRRQDDATRQVISRELSKLRNSPLQRQTTPPTPFGVYGGSRVGKLRPAQAQLNRNLQQYLTSLGFLPQSEVDGQSGIQRQEANFQVKFSITCSIHDLWMGQAWSHQNPAGYKLKTFARDFRFSLLFSWH